MEWYLKVMRDNYSNFSGRARRKEYWMFSLFFFIVAIAAAILAVSDKEIEKKCKIFRDFHYQYDSVFKQIANTKKITPFYFYDFKTEDSDETDTFGLFKTKEECSSFSKMLQKELNYFILECKYFKGV